MWPTRARFAAPPVRVQFIFPSDSRYAGIRLDTFSCHLLLVYPITDFKLIIQSTVKYDERASAVGLPDEKEEQIKAFMTLLNEKNDISIIYCTNEYSQEQMQAIRQVVKVNPVKNFEEQSTYLFAPADADSKENGIDYYGFLVRILFSASNFATLGSRSSKNIS